MIGNPPNIVWNSKYSLVHFHSCFRDFDLFIHGNHCWPATYQASKSEGLRGPTTIHSLPTYHLGNWILGNCSKGGVFYYIQYWTERIAQTVLLWSKTTLITGGVAGAGVDPPS